MKKENQRVALTKRLLREALFRLLQAEPLNKITITDLCKEAGVNRATFYHHYAAPRDVLVEAATEVSQHLQELSPPVITLSEAEAYMEKICAYLKEQSAIIKVLFQCETDQDLAATIAELNRYIWENDQSLLEHTSLDKDNVRLISTFFINGAYRMIRCWLLEDINKSPKEIAHLICSMVRFEIFQINP